MSQNSQRGWIYLIHFSGALHHAQHYLGWTHGRLEQVQVRFDRHVRGTGAKICAAAVRKGLTLQLVATWAGSKEEERKLKRRSRLAAHCPVCQWELLCNGQKKRRI